MKPLIIFHAPGCLDGFGAAFAAWKHFGDEAEYLPMGYKDPRVAWDATRAELIFPTAVAGREVFVLDFSFPLEVTLALTRLSAGFTWLDHHQTAFEMWCGGIPDHGVFFDSSDGSFIRLDNNRSGAALAWSFFRPGERLPALIEYIEDRDLWRFALKGTEHATAALASYPMDFATWDRFVGNEAELLAEGEAIRRYYRQQLDGALAVSRTPLTLFLGGDQEVTGLAANLPPLFASEAGGQLAEESGTFGATYFRAADGKMRFSLRSRGDFDVAALAQRFGGGGHKHAAGFEVEAHRLCGTPMDASIALFEVEAAEMMEEEV